MTKDIEEICEEKARKGDGLFAIAQAIHKLADAQNNVAAKLDFIGYGTTQTRGPLSEIAMQIKGLAAAFEPLCVSASVDISK
jgi:hypothetical protein